MDETQNKIKRLQALKDAINPLPNDPDQRDDLQGKLIEEGVFSSIYDKFVTQDAIDAAIFNLRESPPQQAPPPRGGGGQTPSPSTGGTPSNQALIDYDIVTIVQILDEGTDSGGNPIFSSSGPPIYKLPCPVNLMDIHSANYEGRDFGTANYELNAAETSSTRYGVGLARAGRAIDYGGARAKYALGGLSSYMAENLNIKARAGDDQGYDVYSIAKGVAINPNTELVYRGPNLRSFQLNWKVTNLSQKDLEVAKQFNAAGIQTPSNFSHSVEIVATMLNFYDRLRQIMYPVVDERFASGYPAKISIVVQKNSSSTTASNNTKKTLVSIGNGKLNRTDRKMGCYVTDLQLEFFTTEDSLGNTISINPTAILDSEGQFIEISLSMTVQEAALLNRDSIRQIYE